MDSRNSGIEKVLRKAQQGLIFQVAHYMGEQLLFPPIGDEPDFIEESEVSQLYRELDRIDDFREHLTNALAVVIKGMPETDKSDHRQLLLPPDDPADLGAWAQRDREVLQVVVLYTHDEDLPLAHAEVLGELVRAARVLLASPAARLEASQGNREVAVLQRLCDDADEILSAE